MQPAPVYTGRVYQAASGQWSWAVSCDGVDVVRAAGYESEDAARDEMDSELDLLSQG